VQNVVMLLGFGWPWPWTFGLGVVVKGLGSLRAVVLLRVADEGNAAIGVR
jgi:hypothetical protein